MGTEFNAAMKAYFGCHQGAYSVVTSDEYRKSQVTFVGPEKTIAEAFFGERLNHNHGNIEQIRAQGHDPEVQFRKFPTGELISLTVSYKSNRPMELRYYLRKDIFKPKAGEYWGLFVKDNAIWLFHLSEWMLNEICKGELPASSRAELLEPEIDDFQEVINQTPAAIIGDLRKLISTRRHLLEALSIIEDDVIALYR
jgi:hypothetical protein